MWPCDVRGEAAWIVRSVANGLVRLRVKTVVAWRKMGHIALALWVAVLATSASKEGRPF